MFGNKEHTHTTTSVERVPIARGGVSLGPILTGVVVALGAMFLLSAIVGGVIAGLGVTDTIDSGEAIEAGLGAGIALVVAQLLAYLWGGYTAGRMSRGAGLANGLLVPLVAILLAVAVGAVATVLGAEANLNLPFTTNRLPLERDLLVDWGVGIGVASLIAMFLGGALGGLMGARWHTKLERQTVEKERLAHREEEHVHSDTTRGEAHATGQSPLAPPPPRPDGEPVGTGQRADEPQGSTNDDGTYTQRSSSETQTFRS